MNIKKLGRFEFAPHYIYEAHQHDEYEINYILTGRCIMTINEHKLPLRKGDCAVVEPGTRHNFMVSGTQACKITQFEFLTLSSDLFVQNEGCLKLTNCVDVLDSIEMLYFYRKSAAASEYYNQLLDLELKKLFVLLNMHLEKAHTIHHICELNPLKEILAYLDEHYDRTIDLDRLASEYHISTRYMRKLFTRYIGFSAIDYITMLRLEKAKELLKNSSLSVSEIAIQVGYNSLPYFSAVFKKKIDTTPNSFRQQYQLR